MMRVFLLIGLFAISYGNDYADMANKKWSVLKRFDETYVAEIKNENQLVAETINRDFRNEFKAAQKNRDLIDPIDLKYDASYFIRSWSAEHKTNVQILVDIYVKYLAMWASLIFKVCFLWEYNHIPVDSNTATSCEKVSFYMRWFHTTYFDKKNDDFETLLREKFTSTKISEKLAYVNAVTTEISNLFDVTYVNVYQPATPETPDSQKAKEKLKEIFPNLYSSYCVDRDSRVETFAGKMYADIWITLLDVYGQDLIDVENYFNRMLGGTHKITSVVELIPSFLMSDQWLSARRFSAFLSSNEEDDDHLNKGGKILMQIEKIMEIAENKLTSITIHEITAEEIPDSQTSDFRVIFTDDHSEGKVIPLNELGNPTLNATSQ